MESYQIKSTQTTIGELQFRHPLPLPSVIRDGADQLEFWNEQNQPSSLRIDFESGTTLTDELPHNKHNIEVLKRLQKSGRLDALSLEIVSLKELAQAKEQNVEKRYEAVDIVRGLRPDEQVRWARHFNISQLDTDVVLRVKLIEAAELAPDEFIDFANNPYKDIFLDFDEASDNGIVSFDHVENIYRFGDKILSNNYGESVNTFVLDHSLYEALKRKLRGGVARATGIQGAETAVVEEVKEDENIPSGEEVLVLALEYPTLATRMGQANKDVKISFSFGPMKMEYDDMIAFLNENTPARRSLFQKVQELKSQASNDA